MAKPIPPTEVTRTEQNIGGLKHVSVFLAQAFEQQAIERAKAMSADQAPPSTDTGLGGKQ